MLFLNTEFRFNVNQKKNHLLQCYYENYEKLVMRECLIDILNDIRFVISYRKQCH